MKTWLAAVAILLVFLVGCQAAMPVEKPTNPKEKPTAADPVEPATLEGSPLLHALGAAPEITNTIWLNSPPLRLMDLRGKVVLLDMWTYGCINCRNTIPSLRSWHEKYQDKGLIIIANHYPEFSYEADIDNLKKALVDLDIEYAVAQDNDGVTWRAYHNRYWPTLYLIDKRGDIRFTHIGEGRYDEIEKAIQALLAERYPEE